MPWRTSQEQKPSKLEPLKTEFLTHHVQLENWRLPTSWKTASSPATQLRSFISLQSMIEPVLRVERCLKSILHVVPFVQLLRPESNHSKLVFNPQPKKCKIWINQETSTSGKLSGGWSLSLPWGYQQPPSPWRPFPCHHRNLLTSV